MNIFDHEFDHAPYGRCDWCYRKRDTRRYVCVTNYGNEYNRYLCEECIRKAESRKDKIEGRSVCEILESHHKKLKDDPDRLSTDFLKELIGPRARHCIEPET